MNQEEKIKTEYSDEINLMDYIKIILRRKWLIFLVFVLAIIVAGVFSFVSPKIYRVETILEIGYGYAEGVEGIRTIEPLAHMVEKIRLGIYIELIGARLDIPKNLKIKSENPRDTNLLIIKAESAEPKLAKVVLQEINSLILLDHQERVKVRRELEDIQSTKVIRAPIILEAPIKPRPVLNMSIAGILGIFFGTFLAFLQEFLQKNN